MLLARPFIIFAALFVAPNMCLSQKVISDYNFKNKVGSIEVAVVVANDGEIDQYMSSEIAKTLSVSNNYNSTPSFFNSNFVTDGSFDKLFKASRFKIKRLKLEDHLDYLCLCQYNILYEDKNEFDLHVCKLTLNLNMIDASNGVIKNSLIFFDRGTGISRQEALQNAFLKLCKQIKITNL